MLEYRNSVMLKSPTLACERGDKNFLWQVILCAVLRYRHFESLRLILLARWILY